MDEQQVIASRMLFRAESHLRNQMMLLASFGYYDQLTGHQHQQALVDAIRILFEAGWRI